MLVPPFPYPLPFLVLLESLCPGVMLRRTGNHSRNNGHIIGILETYTATDDSRVYQSMYEGSQIFDRLKILVRRAARMTNIPMEKMSSNTAFCFSGIWSFLMSGIGMHSMRQSEVILKQACTIA